MCYLFSRSAEQPVHSSSVLLLYIRCSDFPLKSSCTASSLRLELYSFSHSMPQFPHWNSYQDVLRVGGMTVLFESHHPSEDMGRGLLPLVPPLSVFPAFLVPFLPPIPAPTPIPHHSCLLFSPDCRREGQVLELLGQLQ